MPARPPLDSAVASHPSSTTLSAWGHRIASAGRRDARPAPHSRQGSVRRTVLGALALLVLLTAAGALHTRHQLSYRVHDYAILNLAGQLREMASAMALDAGQFTLADPLTLTDREISGYRERLARKAAQFDRIVDSFETRNLTPDLTGLDEPVSCSWDEASLDQLRATAGVWRQMRQSVTPALDPTAAPETVLDAAAVVAAQGDAVLDASRTLSLRFKDMMQRKLDSVIAAQLGLLAIAAALGAAVMVWLRRRVVQPLQAAEQAALRIVGGGTAAPLSEQGDREIAAVGQAKNRLSARLRLLFEVAERTGGGLTTG